MTSALFVCSSSSFSTMHFIKQMKKTKGPGTHFVHFFVCRLLFSGMFALTLYAFYLACTVEPGYITARKYSHRKPPSVSRLFSVASKQISPHFMLLFLVGLLLLPRHFVEVRQVQVRQHYIFSKGLSNSENKKVGDCCPAQSIKHFPQLTLCVCSPSVVCLMMDVGSLLLCIHTR